MFVPELRSLIFSRFNMLGVPWLSIDSGTIFSHFQKINNTQEGKQIYYNFDNIVEYGDYIQYIQHAYLSPKGIDNKTFFEQFALAEALYHPNTRLIIDFPEDATENMPFLQMVRVQHIHDIAEAHGKTEYLIVKKKFGRRQYEKQWIEVQNQNESFVEQKEVFYIYDDATYQIWERNLSDSIPKEVSNKPHQWGVTPVIAVSDYKQDTRNQIFKKSQLSDSLDEIWNWTLGANMTEYHYQQKGIPASIGIKSKCKQIDEESGKVCENGYFFIHTDELDKKDKPIMRVRRCKSCERKAKEKMQFGKQVEIAYEDIFTPNAVNTQAIQVLRDSLGFIATDTNFFEKSNQKLDKDKARIKSHITGEGFNQTQSKEAFNESYINVSTDDKQNNLATFSAKMEALQIWCDSMIAKGRYLTFVSMSCWYGRGYFLKSTLDYQKELTTLLEKTGDAFLILSKLNEIGFSELRYAPDMIEISKLIRAVIPYQDINNEQLLKYLDKIQFNDIQKIQVVLRLNQINLTQEFLLFQKDKLLNSGATLKTIFNKMMKWFYGEAEKIYKNQKSYYFLEENGETELTGLPQGVPDTGNSNAGNSENFGFATA